MPEQSKEKTTAIKSTKTALKVRGIVKNMYREAREAKSEGRPVAYVMMNSYNDEILRAMGVTPIWTENYAGVCAAKRDAERFLVAAESDGYSNCICGYVRTGLGFDVLRREVGGIPADSPDGGMVQPDMMIGSSCVCDPRYKWYQSTSRLLDIPVYSNDVVYPSGNDDLKQVAPSYIKYQVEQYKDLINFLEKQTGQKLDYDKLSEVLQIAEDTYQIWWDIEQLRKAIPSPMPSGDHFTIMVPGRFYLGVQLALDFYRELYDEIKERVDNGIGVIKDEKYRLLWGGGLPPWHTMWIYNRFEELGAVCCVEDAYLQWEPYESPVGVDNPLEFMAWRVFKLATLYHEQAKQNSGSQAVERKLRLAREYSCDGIVMHGTRSCRAETIGHMHMTSLIQQSMPIPALLLESDLIDLRDYSEAQWLMNIDNFMETVKTHKEAK